jgi:hypothetical protein
MTPVEQMDTASVLNYQIQKLPNAMVSWNESIEPSIGGLELH